MAFTLLEIFKNVNRFNVRNLSIRYPSAMNSLSPALFSKRQSRHLFAANGAISLVIGLIFIIAFNWTGLTSHTKFWLLQGLIAALTVGAVWLGLSLAIGKALLVIAMGCVGPLLAVFGQTYQTGADVWQLFLGWAVLSFIWAIAARSPIGWLLWVVLAQAALWLFLNTFFDLSFLVVGAFPLWAAVGFVNGFLLVAWEFAATKFVWLTGRLAPRLIAGVLGLVMTAGTVYAFFSEKQLGLQNPVIGWLLMISVGYFVYVRIRRDIVITTFGWVSIASVALALVMKLFFKVDLILAMFFGFLTLLGSIVFGVKWVRRSAIGKSHWIVDIAAGFGAWVAMLFLMLFILLLFGEVIFKSTGFLLIFCALFFVAAVALDRSGEEAIFRKQLSTVFSFAAPTAMFLVVASAKANAPYGREDSHLAVYAASAIALALWYFLRSKTTRSMMAIVSTFAFIAMMDQLHLTGLTVWALVAVAVAIWLIAPNSFITDAKAIALAANNERIHRLTEFGYAVSLWALLLGVGWRSNNSWGRWYMFWFGRESAFSPNWASNPWLPVVFAFLLAVLAYVGIANGISRGLRDGTSRIRMPLLLDTPFILIFAAFAALSAMYAPYLLVCAIFLAIGLCSERLKLTALATLGTVAALFEYYFYQGTPLWLKGFVLLTLGTLLLLAAYRAARNQPTHLESEAQ
jgi:Domain of unknown function (DUF4401)/Predicted membrane protein (DUF2157)